MGWLYFMINIIIMIDVINIIDNIVLYWDILRYTLDIIDKIR